MNREKCKQLRAEGWREIPETEKWINVKGEQLNQRTGKVQKVQKVSTTYGKIKVEKVILWLFKGQTPRSGQIIHINGDKANHTPENVKYASLNECVNKEIVNRADLLGALRCYYEIDRKEKPNTGEFITRLRLKDIANYRRYTERNKKEPFFDVFADWLNVDITQIQNIKQIADKHDLGIRDTRTIIARYVNRLTSEILNDLQVGKLRLLQYIENKRERRKRETKELHSNGYKRKAQIRFPKDIKKGFDDLGIKTPEKPDFKNVGSLQNDAKLIIWLCRADEFLGIYTTETTDNEKQRKIESLQSLIKEKISKLTFF